MKPNNSRLYKWPLSAAGGRWKLKTELDGEKWSVAYAPLRGTRHISK